jgi:Cd2+/Zn2+-exporting ATPase
MESTTFRIEELCCVDEERAIRKRLKKVGGIETLAFDFLSHRLVVGHTCPRHELSDALHDIGFTCRLDNHSAPSRSTWDRYHLGASTIASGSLLSLGLILDLLGVSPMVVVPVLLGSIVSGGWKIGGKAYLAVKRLSMDMNVLMVIAAVGAVIIRKYEEGAAVMFLFAVSNWLEHNSLERSKRRIGELLNFAPATAQRIRNGSESTVPVEQIMPGDRIMVRPGERIPLDGTVREGRSTVNQSAVTGESLPREKNAGDFVFAGSINDRGVLELEVLKPYADTTIARMVRMVEDAQAQRAPLQTLSEQFARYYTPAVVAIAVLTTAIPPLLFHEPFAVWFYNALVMLVIACPCALVISTPVTIVSALANAARNGVLIKGGRHLEAMGHIGAIAFDKTGTLTSGTPKVTDIVPVHEITESEVLQIAAAIEQGSEHHLAGAVLRRADDDEIANGPAAVQNFEALAGRGVSATMNGDTYFIGNHALIEERRICSPKIENILSGLEQRGKTTIIVARNDQPLGIIAVEDAPRSESRDIVRRLHALGTRNVIMLTGDEEGTAKKVAEAFGIDEYHANLLPEEKMTLVGTLRERYKTVAMVGDGINDAPALAASTVGIAMGGAGTDVAMETADIVLMSDNLLKLPYLMRLARKAISIIKQNMAIALLTKLFFLGLALSGHASLWMAILADDGATFVVIMNGLRALRLKEEE